MGIGTLAVLLVIAAAAALLAAGYWGAGLVLHPPKMSAMAVFPEDFGLRYEEVEFKTADGLRLKGWFIPSPNDEERTLLMGHGWGDNKGELLAATQFLSKAGGFNLFYFDNRSHGESEGGFTTIGCLETIDFHAAMDYLKAERPWCLKRLGVFGLSMGAAVGAMTIHEHPEVKAAVFESPFTDYREVVRRWAWINLHMPYFPLMMVILFMLRLRVGRSDVDSYSPIRFIDRIAPRPVLLIGGSEDRLMPPSVVRALYERAREPKELWIIPGASHGKCHEVAGAAYEARVIEFFRKHL